MSLADDVKEALDQVRLAQEKLMSGFGGNPPKELIDQFKAMQDKTSDMSWVQQLSDQIEEAKAQAQAAHTAAARDANDADGEGKAEDRDVDFEAYPWKFQSEHKPAPQKLRDLRQTLQGELMGRIGSAPKAKESVPPPAPRPAKDSDFDSLGLAP
jgi:hypothetical protein